MNNKISKTISFVFVLFILANSIIINFSKDGVESTETGFQPIIKGNEFRNSVENDDFLQVVFDLSQDMNKNGFQDDFEKKLLHSEDEILYDAILSFKQSPSQRDIDYLNNNKILILRKYHVINAFHIKGTTENLLNLMDYTNLNLLEENIQSQSLLFDATNQIEARRVWASNQGYNYRGNPNTAIAILDTGIDDSHTYANFDVIYWKDFVGADSSVSGDEYATPTDKGEHGTHCAAIAASSGEWPISDFHFQDSGRFPTDEGYAYYGSWFYLPRDDGNSVDIKYSWEGGGTPFVGILDTQSNWVWHNYYSPDTSSPASYSISIQNSGWYVVAWGNKVGAGGNFYSGEVTYHDDWNYSFEYGHGPFTGVAPDSKIVG
ncbi:MAG: S8 family serine peptidase, partial [Candidatus Heimdallarchaeaceae archaeon]